MQCQPSWERSPGRGKIKAVAAILKAFHAQEDRQAAEEKIQAVTAKLEQMKLSKAATMVREGAQETLSFYKFPQAYWRHLRTNNTLERIMREIRQWTRVVGNFPDGESALMQVSARLLYMAGTRWGTRRYMSMERFNDVMEEEVSTTA